MKIVLLFPPPGKVFQPYSSLPALTAFMRRAGYEVIQRDVSIEAVEDLLTEKRLSQAWERVAHRLEVLDCQETLSPEQEAEREALCCVAVSAEYVSHHIDQAKQTLRSPADFFDFDRLIWALNLVRRARELLSAEYYPSSWSTDHMIMPRYDRSVSKLLAATEDADENIFLSYFRDTVVPSIRAENPDLIGISITHSGQLIPGLTLARLLKSCCPKAHICLGGALLSYLIRGLQQNPSIFTVVDTIVVYEGEHALLALMKALEKGSGLSAVPNLLYLDHGQVQATPLYVERVNDLPTPDYRGLPLELYLTPEVTALLPTERGCYWRRCAFCAISKGMDKYRPRKIELVLEDMKSLSQQLNTRCFFLANDAMPPARMRALAQAISAEGLDFLWETEARLEKSLTPETCRTLGAGGCRRLMLGLESGSQRVLDLMDKGITVEQAVRAIHGCYDAGISTHVFLMVGFPTETRQEARETLDLVRDHHPVIHSIDYAQYGLHIGSRVYDNPEHYGVTWMETVPCDSLTGSISNYEVGCGMTREEVSLEVYPHGKRFVRQNISTMSFPFSLLLSYLVHFGVTRLEQLPNMAANSMVRPSADQPILNLALRPAGRLFYRPLNSKAAVVFNPTSGKVIIAPATVKTLLSLCNGQDTVQRLASRLASTSEGVDFIKLYYLGLQLCTQLIDWGFLTVARPASVSGN